MAGKVFELGAAPVSVEAFTEACGDETVSLTIAPEVLQRVRDSRALLERLMSEGRVIYGVNTSMGGFVRVLVPEDNASELQDNLLASVATNVGAPLEDSVVRAVMLARIISLSKGVSAVSPRVFTALVELFNRRLYPVIPEKGSLGASGDLGPLSYIALVLTGKWKVRVDGTVMDAAPALARAGLAPVTLEAKDGLALINGTSAMTALAALNWRQAQDLFDAYLLVSCLSFETLRTKLRPFDPRAHAWKRHRGQAEVAARIHAVCRESRLMRDDRDEEAEIRRHSDGTLKDGGGQIEDAYSLRCTPQILGPVADCLDTVKRTVEDELNSVSDNPLVIPSEGDAFHNGHFHGQYIAMAMDQLSVAMTTLCNLSDRRIDRFMDRNNSNGLPAFLCPEPRGLRFGLMGGQYMSASVTAETRSLCAPVSVQSLTSTGDFQDIVSLGLVAARRAREICGNARYVAAFELLCGCAAADLRGGPEGLAPATRALYGAARARVPAQRGEAALTPDLEALSGLLAEPGLARRLAPEVREPA